MTNQSGVSDSYIVRKIIRAMYPTGATPTAEELLEKVDLLVEENNHLHAHDRVKEVHGWKAVEMCTGCGATYSLEQLAEIAPQAVSCCPERDMQRTLVPANYGSVTEAARSNLIENVAAVLQCRHSADDYPRILTALHDVIQNSQAKTREIVELEKERDGFKRTLDLTNGAIDSLCDMVGAPGVDALRSRISGMIDRCRVLDEMTDSGLSAHMVALPVGLQMQTAELVTTFAENLAQRLHYKQRQGYTGWDSDEWKDDCLRSLHTSEKPLDVAAFAVFAWYHDWSGSYEALMTMPGEMTLQTATPQVNVTVNFNATDLASAVREALANHKNDDPVGFRTEPENDLHRRIVDCEEVDQAILDVVNDSTDENGVRVVRAVYEALQREGKIR